MRPKPNENRRLAPGRLMNRRLAIGRLSPFPATL
jgi:hypothetical protein